MSEHTRLIPLTQDKHATVDAADYEWLSERKWLFNGLYARRSNRKNGKQINVYMHREILSRVLGRSLTYHEQVDHINRDKLDNRRSNLRLATSSQNKQNRDWVLASSKSGIRNVRYEPEAKTPYLVILNIGGKPKKFGRFHTLAEAETHAIQMRIKHYTHSES